MKRFSILFAALVLAAPVLRAQDAAVLERIDKLAGQIKDITESQEAQRKRIEELSKAVKDMQDQQARPNAAYASQESLRELNNKIQEVDQNRKNDSELILKQLEKIRSSVTAQSRVAQVPSAPAGDGAPEKGYEY